MELKHQKQQANPAELLHIVFSEIGTLCRPIRIFILFLDALAQ